MMEEHPQRLSLMLAMSPSDSYFRTGLYPSKKPEILGKEGYGTIVSLGSDEKPLQGLSVGDKVVWMGGSGYAEYTAAPALHTYKIPDGLDGKLALASFLQGLTALSLIREAHPVKAGEYVLVHAAAGGVGLLLCQMLKATGAHVVATASSQEKLDLAKKNGAEFLINYSEEKDLVAKVLEITPGGQGVDVVFDGVGKSTFEDDLLMVKRKGSLVSFGNASGAVPPFAIS
jgi:NADPH2:quinone reductase